MKKIILIFLAAFVIFISSCIVSYKIIKNEEIERPQRLEGRISFVGTMLEDPVATWSFGNYSYSVPFKNPFLPTITFFEVIEPDYQKKIELGLTDSNKVISFTNLVSKAGIETYVHMPGFIPLFDSSKSVPIKIKGINKDSYLLDEDCLQFLNDNIDADYYMVCIGRLHDYQLPNIFNGFNFKLAPEYRIIIYDREGRKVFSKSYVYLFEKIKDSHMLVMTYYNYLNFAIISNKNIINEDFSMLNDCNEAKVSIERFVKLFKKIP